MKKRKLLILFISLIMANFVFADTPTAITTFESIGIYWTPSSGSPESVSVRYRVRNTTPWFDGLSMKRREIVDNDSDSDPNAIGIYRGSIVNLSPNTEYEVELSIDGGTTKTIFATTWKEVNDLTIPVEDIHPVGDRSSTYTISHSPLDQETTEYALYDGTNSVIDVDDTRNYCIKVAANSHHIIIRGFELIGAHKHGIYIENGCHDIIIENCDISNWGYMKDGYAHEHDGGVRSDGSDVKRIIIQRCRIHHPRNDANSWKEFNAGNGEPDHDNKTAYHPRGAQAVVLMKSGGNHVIRYNEFYSDYTHMFNDVIGSGGNASFNGFPTADTDIYGNYLSHCWDDAIEVEGADRNVRVWGNYFEHFFLGIANAPVSTGPLYVWGNTSGRSFSPNGSKHGIYGQFMKMGTTSSKENMMQGYTYIFNNTILQPNGEGSGGIGTKEDHDKKIHYCIAKNNVLHVRDDCERSLSNKSGNTNFTYSHNLWSEGHPAGENKTPTYINGASVNVSHSGSTPITVNYFLKSSSDGYNSGTPIPNFTTGSSPDMGAFEHGNSPREYGVNAYLGGSPSQYTLATNVNGSGSILLSPSGGVYNSGTEVTLTATPNNNWQFDGWSGDLSGSNNPTTITITSNKSVTANFSEIGGEILTYDAFYATINTGTTSTTNGDYNGDGYANVDNQNGTYVEWSNVNVNTAGSYNCTIRYASNSNRPGNVEVNGSVATTLQGTSTGNFQTWGTETVTFDLNAGNNTIRLTGTTSSSLGNIDQITLEYVGGNNNELLTNNNFNNGLSNWELYVNPGGDATYNIDNSGVISGDNSVHVNVIDAFDAYPSGKIQLIQHNIIGGIEAGTEYNISFKIKSTKNIGKCFWVVYDEPGYEGSFYAYRWIALQAGNTVSYSYNYTATNTDPSVYFALDFGSFEHDNVELWIDDVYFTKLTDESGIIDSRIEFSHDDAEEKTNGISLESSQLELVHISSGDQTLGFRFRDVTIPNGATIDDAYLEFTAKKNGTGSYSLTIKGEDVNNSAEFATSPTNNISSRTMTTASQNWEPDPWTIDLAYQTTDISDIIEEIVNRTGWNSGNNLSLIITGNGSSKKRKAYSFDSAPSKAPKLHVEYSTNGGANKIATDKKTTVNLKWELAQNYPNPFNPSTNISFTVPKASHVKIVVYDMLGREVSKVVDNFYESGSYNYSWMAKDENGTQLSTGIYIARIQSGNFVKSIKMMLLR